MLSQVLDLAVAFCGNPLSELSVHRLVKKLIFTLSSIWSCLITFGKSWLETLISIYLGVSVLEWFGYEGNIKQKFIDMLKRNKISYREI
jgi:hypothetical protein